MKTFHEWLAERPKNEGFWLNDKNAVVGMSTINPLLQKKAKVKPLKLPKAKLGDVHHPQTQLSPKHRTRKYSSKFFAS
jgi:hypothetical protein